MEGVWLAAPYIEKHYDRQNGPKIENGRIRVPQGPGLGIEPEIAFSACFGAPFMVHHPFKYADMLRAKMEKHGANCWLVNTGWVGGGWGVGKRISIRHTRNLLNAALEGKLDDVKYRKDKLFGFEVPLSCPDVPEDVLDPSTSWGNQDEYWQRYDALAARYIENFKLFADQTPAEVLAAGPNWRASIGALKLMTSHPLIKRL